MIQARMCNDGLKVKSTDLEKGDIHKVKQVRHKKFKSRMFKTRGPSPGVQ